MTVNKTEEASYRTGRKVRSLPRHDRSRWIAETSEVAAIWLAVLLAGLFIVQIMLWANQDASHESWRDQRLGIAAANLAARLETGLALGLDPVSDGSAGRALEETYDRDPTLFSVALVDLDGHILADSDRASVGGNVDAAVLSAARTDNVHAWHAMIHGTHVQSEPVKTVFGETVAYVMLFSRDDQLHDLSPNVPFLGSGETLWALLCVMVVLACWGARGLIREREAMFRHEAMSGERMYEQSQAVALRRADALDACLAGLSEDAVPSRKVSVVSKRPTP